MNNMTPINHFNLWSFDINLLVAFDALSRDLSVTRAAARLKIGQPAMSHNLNTLRLLMGDELFVRVGQTMRPTPRALAIAGPVRAVMEQLQRAILTPESFHAQAEVRTFHIGVSNEMETLLIPRLIASIQPMAGGVKILARPALPDMMARMLDDGVIDLAVGCFGVATLRHRRSLIFEQALACCFNPDLLALAVPMDRETYMRQQHALVSQNNSIRGCMGEALRAAGAELNVVVAAPEFLTILSAAQQAPVVATLPSRVVAKFGPGMGLAVSPVPLDLDLPPISMVWAAHAENDPASLWLRDQITPLIDGYAVVPDMADTLLADA